MKRFKLQSIGWIGNSRLFTILLLFFIITPEFVIRANNLLRNHIIIDNVTNASASEEISLLPSGRVFPFWDDMTKYSKVLHVDQKNLHASDENPGTIDKPLKTINAAALLLQPGEKVIVHEGVYRECVHPARGGKAADKMIAYEAAEGERVVIKGSEIWKPKLRQSTGWKLREADTGVTIWMADIPEEFFKAYNPFLARDAYHYITQYGQTGDVVWMKRAMLFRGAVYIDGRPLKQVYAINELSKNVNSFWVEDPGLRLHLNLPKEMNISTSLVEITTREQIFAPRDFGFGYVRVSGFTFEQAADGLPVPQRAAVSTMRGHHWIIEKNRIQWINACGLDIGSQSWDAASQEINGHHIIRNNIIRETGICGIAGAGGADYTLIENNLIEQIGNLDLERMFECAAIKFHLSKNILIRNNIIRHITHAGGIWFDCSARDCRIVNNILADIQTLTAGIYMEMDFGQNLIDHNILWDIRSDIIPNTWKPPYVHGSGIRADCNDSLIISHNMFGKVQFYAVCLNTVQSMRKWEGRTGLCFVNKVVNNIFYNCPNRIYLAKQWNNIIDGNVYDVSDDNCSFILMYPEPSILQNLAGWQNFFKLDTHSKQVKIQADFDNIKCLLNVTIEGILPECYHLDTIMSGKATSSIHGPFNTGPIQRSPQVFNYQQIFPVNFPK